MSDTQDDKMSKKSDPDMYSKVFEQPASRKRVSAVSKDTNQKSHVDGKLIMTLNTAIINPAMSTPLMSRR